jgi:hypothetical protein
MMHKNVHQKIQTISTPTTVILIMANPPNQDSDKSTLTQKLEEITEPFGRWLEGFGQMPNPAIQAIPTPKELERGIMWQEILTKFD